MKKFNIVSTDLGELKGEGFYKTNEEYIFIDTKDENIRKFFLKRAKEKLTTVQFSGFENDAIFSGDFLINTIFLNHNTFMTEIIIKINKV